PHRGCKPASSTRRFIVNPRSIDFAALHARRSRRTPDSPVAVDARWSSEAKAPTAGCESTRGRLTAAALPCFSCRLELPAVLIIRGMRDLGGGRVGWCELCQPREPRARLRIESHVAGNEQPQQPRRGLLHRLVAGALP